MTKVIPEYYRNGIKVGQNPKNNYSDGYYAGKRFVLRKQRANFTRRFIYGLCAGGLATIGSYWLGLHLG